MALPKSTKTRFAVTASAATVAALLGTFAAVPAQAAPAEAPSSRRVRPTPSPAATSSP